VRAGFVDRETLMRRLDDVSLEDGRRRHIDALVEADFTA
jgi:hypothetical protein